MRKRIWTMALAVLVAVSPQGAAAASFGTMSWAGLTPYGDQPSASVSEAATDVWPATSSASLADGASSAAATTPFGANHASVASQAGVSAYAASLWSDTFTITNGSETSVASVGFQLSFAGTLDAGPAIGGYAQAVLHVLVGTGTSGDVGLAPAIVQGAAASEISESCELDGDDLPSAGCAPGVLGASTLLELETAFTYGAPFRLDVLLEALARNGGVADFAPSGWLARIDLPAGATLSAASGWDYGALVASVPEPGTGLLCALGIAALAARRARG